MEIDLITVLLAISMFVNESQQIGVGFYAVKDGYGDQTDGLDSCSSDNLNYMFDWVLKVGTICLLSPTAKD